MTAPIVDPRDHRFWPVMPLLIHLPVKPVRVVMPWAKANGKPLTVWVNQSVAGHLVRTASYVRKNHLWSPSRMDSYNHRLIQGTTTWSLHSAGLALDVFDRPWPQPIDPRGPTNAPPSMWLRLWRDCGWDLGKDFRNPDWPHIEWVRTKKSGTRPRLAIEVEPVIIRPPLLLVAPLTARKGDPA